MHITFEQLRNFDGGTEIYSGDKYIFIIDKFGDGRFALVDICINDEFITQLYDLEEEKIYDQSI